MGKGSGAGGARGGGARGGGGGPTMQSKVESRINDLLSSMTGSKRADYIRSELDSLPLGARLEYITEYRTAQYEKEGIAIWRVSGTPETMMSGRLASSFSGVVHGKRTKVKIRT